MGVILFPNKKEMKRLCNSIFRGGVLCPEYCCKEIEPEGELSDVEYEVLSEIQRTVVLVKKKVEDLINEIPFSEIAQKYRYENSFTNWRDRSHFIRLCLEMLDKEIDGNVLYIMGLMEIFYLSWLIADEAIDEAKKCEGKETIYNKEGISSICISNVIHTIVSKVLQKIIKNKKPDVDTLQKMQEIIAEIWDKTWYGFYEDEKKTEILEGINQKGENRDWYFLEREMEYFRRIELIWGSHFEGGIRLALSLFPEIGEEKLKLFGKIGRLWGKMLKLRDDIIDIVGDKVGLGREVFEDIIASNDGSIKVKKTLPLIRLIKEKGGQEIIKKLANDKKGLSEIKKKLADAATEQEELKNISLTLEKAIEYSQKRLQLIASEINGLLMRFPDTDAKISLMKLAGLVSTIRY